MAKLDIIVPPDSALMYCEIIDTTQKYIYKIGHDTSACNFFFFGTNMNSEEGKMISVTLCWPMLKS